MEVLSDGPAEAETEKKSVAFASRELDVEEHVSHLYKRVKDTPARLGQIKSWRLAGNEDIDAIEGLMIISEENMGSLYNTPHLDHLLEKSHFPIVQLDENEKIVSFAAFQSHPNIPSVPPFSWIEWINEKYRLTDANSSNTLFVHYMVWDPAYKTEFLYLLLKTTFLEFVHLKYIIFIKPPCVLIPEVYEKHFIPVYPCDVTGSKRNLQSVNICPRCSLIEQLHIRTAIAEDSDFLMSVLGDGFGNTFEKLYGEFCFSEVEESLSDCDRKVLVCEVDGIPAGVMVLNLSVDLEKLKDFELMPFHGLRSSNERSSTSSMDSMPSGTRTPEIIEALRAQEFDILENYSFGLGTSVVDLKENESATSSDDTFEIDFNVLNVSPSLQKLIRGDESDSEESTPPFEFYNVDNGDVLDTGEINSRREKKLLRLASTLPSPQFDGEPNVFAIEFFALDNTKFDPRQSVDFLEASFSIAYPKDYCILMVPTQTAPLPLLNHFVKASHRGGKQPRCELYICHKNTFSRLSVTVREVVASDSNEIKRFLQRTYSNGVILSEIQGSFRGYPSERSFALVVGSHIVGIALIRFSYDFEVLARHFDVAEFSILKFHGTNNRSLIKHILVIPPCQSFAKFFLLEIMRLADVTCLFHLYHHDTKLNGSIPSVLEELVPLKPKKMSGRWETHGYDRTMFRLTHDQSFAVFFTNSQLCCRTRINTNKIIVVIGASATAFSFFENIIFGSSRNHVSYSNLIWVSAHGTGQELPPNHMRDLMFPVRDKYDRDYRTLLSLKAHVHFIYGVMTGINRNEKYVIINDGAVIRYDILVLTVGLQFLPPVPEVSKKKQDCCRNKFQRSTLSRFLPGHVNNFDPGVRPNPVNLFEMNTFLEADTILMTFKRLKTRITSGIPAEKVILYGHSITIFVVLQTLLKIGIPGGMIAFVEPFPNRESSVTAFGDLAVYNEIINSIRRSGILYYPEFFLYDWTFSPSDRLSTVTFHSAGAQVTFPCLAFLPLDQKLVSDNNFHACNNAGLIYDGRLVIDNQFKTNDERIYAAGPFTKYSRRYCAPEKSHQYFCSTEIGEKLAQFIRREVEPVDEGCDTFGEGVNMVPTLKKPLMVYCQVPGDCYFFSLRNPGNLVEVESNFESGEIGDILITGDCAMNTGIGYFRLQLDQFGCVQKITCLCKTELDYMNLYALYGLHEKLLNNLLVRYDCGMISDLFEYFQEPWTEAIFHEEFNRLREENLRQFLDETKWSNSLDSKPQFCRRETLELDDRLLEVKSAIEKNVLEFINYFDGELMNYATTETVGELLGERSVHLTVKNRHRLCQQSITAFCTTTVDSTPTVYKPFRIGFDVHWEMAGLAHRLGSDDILREGRKPRCFPQILHSIKTILPGQDFPSKIRVASETSAIHDRDYDGSPSLTEASMKSPCSDKVPIAYWRLADANDVDAIYDLIDKSDHFSEEIFSSPDVPDLIEKSTFAFIQCNSNGEMISFTSALCYPNIPAVPSFEWFGWLERMYEIGGVTPRNSCFIHYMACRPDYFEDFLGLSLEILFMQFPFLKFIALIRPPLVKIPDLIGEYFVPVLPKDMHVYSWDPNSVQTVLLCLRHNLLDRLKIRLAVVEDHDDLMPIIERQTTKLRELYGEFCMAEMIEFPGTEDRKTLVCEVNGYAVAFMNLNRFIDLEQLNSQFNLGVFHGLRKPSPGDVREELLEDGQEKVVFLPAKVSSTSDMINSETMECILNWKPTICKSEADEENDSKSEDSVDSNGLPWSVIELIRDSVEANILPKFSAYALGSSNTDTRKDFYGEDGEAKHSIRTDLSLMSLTNFNLPVYHGPSNAFCIELFAVDENFDEKLCNDFMEAAFELFPDLEYCILTLPSQCTTFPLLELFVRVTPRPLKVFMQELYVCHRSSVMLTFMRVRRILKSDLDEIYNLLRGIANREFIYADIANSCIFPDTAYQGFVLISGTTIVGAAVLCNENGLEYLTEHYHVGDLIDFELHKADYHAVLKHLILSPIYQTHSRFFLRDIMRMADITSLYRARYEERQSQFNTSSLITVLGQLVPVKPRRMIKYHPPSLGRNAPPPHLLNYEVPFALYHINCRICSLQKMTSNINLVIVGSSRTAFSFLENLLYAPNSAYVTYNNITWVSPHGTGSELPSHPARDLIFPYRGRYNKRYKAQISLHSFVNTVYGVMTAINRADKYVTINNSAIIRYDYLVILCGKQYLMPVPLAKERVKRKCSRGTRTRCSLFKYLVDQKTDDQNLDEYIDYPSNVFLINTVNDATNAFIAVQYLMRKRKNIDAKEKIIVYGRGLNIYLCIQSLLKFGIPPELLVLVESASNNISEEYFPDPNVDAAVTNILKDLNISLYRGYVLYDWTFCDNNQIGSVTFHSQHQKITIRCMAMFPYDRRNVSEVTFKAVNEASLVYDGRLVINHRFQTNDPYIYSAGTCTKYQRKYFANDKSHEYYDPTEAAKILAEIVRSQIDPTELGNEPETEDEQLPELKSPVMISGQLPGDWNYLHLRKPGKSVPLEVQCNIKEFGDTLITGDCKMSNGYGYFKLYLDDFGFVRSITCFTKDTIDIENLPMLYGKHEKYLNNLLMRFNLGLITDFFTYFRQPWVYVLYHDRFPLLMEANAKLFRTEQSFVDRKVIEMIDDALKDEKYFGVDEDKKNDLLDTFEVSNIKDKMRRNVIRYLETFEEAFPMYATSGILRVLLHGVDSV